MELRNIASLILRRDGERLTAAELVQKINAEYPGHYKAINPINLAMNVLKPMLDETPIIINRNTKKKYFAVNNYDFI
jgi:hypothetical protein